MSCTVHLMHSARPLSTDIELMCDNRAMSESVPPLPLTRLLRQVSTEAREGRITGDQKMQIKSYLLTTGGDGTSVMSAIANGESDSKDFKSAPVANGIAVSSSGAGAAMASTSGGSGGSGGSSEGDGLSLVPLLRQVSAESRLGRLTPDLKAIIKRLILSGQAASAQQMLSDHSGKSNADADAPASVPASPPPKRTEPKVFQLTAAGALLSVKLWGSADSTSQSGSDVIRHMFSFLDGASFFSAAAVSRVWQRIAAVSFNAAKMAATGYVCLCLWCVVCQRVGWLPAVALIFLCVVLMCDV